VDDNVVASGIRITGALSKLNVTNTTCCDQSLGDTSSASDQLGSM
jgi:hypothetical protein